MTVLICIIMIWVLIMLPISLIKGAKNRKNGNMSDSTPFETNCKTIRCPNCGSQAKVRGRSWECGWCGDFGTFSG